jgi:hypothetical protein
MNIIPTTPVKPTEYSNSSIFWDMMSCSLLKVNWCFRGTCHLHLQGCWINQAQNHLEAGGKHRAILCETSNGRTINDWWTRNDLKLEGGKWSDIMIWPSWHLWSKTSRSSMDGRQRGPMVLVLNWNSFQSPQALRPLCAPNHVRALQRELTILMESQPSWGFLISIRSSHADTGPQNQMAQVFKWHISCVTLMDELGQLSWYSNGLHAG